MCLYDNADMPSSVHNLLWMIDIAMWTCGHADTGWERLIQSHSSARFCFELSGNLN